MQEIVTPLVDFVRKKMALADATLARTARQLVRDPAGDDMNNVGVRLEVDFLGLQGYQEQAAQSVMRKAVDLQLYQTLADRQGPGEGRVWVGRFGLKELIPIEAVRSKVVELSGRPVEPVVAVDRDAGGMES
jgi:hypothetical protein